MDRVRMWIEVAREPPILRRALVSCVAVGVILTIVNHGPDLVRGQLSAGLLAQIAFTLLVPFFVSLASSVAAIQDHRGSSGAGDAPAGDE